MKVDGADDPNRRRSRRLNLKALLGKNVGATKEHNTYFFHPRQSCMILLRKNCPTCMPKLRIYTCTFYHKIWALMLKLKLDVHEHSCNTLSLLVHYVVNTIHSNLVLACYFFVYHLGCLLWTVEFECYIPYLVIVGLRIS
jgi:hypothetical protein